MISIPNSTKIFAQTNDSDIAGSIWSSLGLDLTENKGRIRLGKRLVLNTDSATTVEVNGIPVAFKLFNNNGAEQIFAVAGQNVVYGNADYPSGTPFVRHPNSPTTCVYDQSDMEVFQNNLYVTTNTTLERLTTGTTWATQDSTLGAGSTHMMCVFPKLQLLYVTTGGTKIWSWNGSAFTKTGAYSLDLGSASGETITFIKAGSDRVWIGTQNTSGGNGSIYEWDGSSTQITKRYILRSSGALSGVIKDDVPYVVDANGNLLVWNGGTFVIKGSFNKSKNKRLYLSQSGTNQRFIHPNGMTVISDNIAILIDGKLYDNTIDLATSQERVPSGIWEYNETNGLYHKHAFGLSKAAGAIVDYGQARVAGVGALAVADYPDNSTARNGSFLAGAYYYTDATTKTYGIFYNDSNDTLQKAGILVTPKIDAGQITDKWQKLYLVYKLLAAAADKITVKYRTVETDPFEIVGTWTSPTTFTTTTDVTSYWASGTGGELEPIQGVGAGKNSHIISVVNNAGTYTVTVDETYAGATGTFKARVNAWTKCEPLFALSQTQDFSEWPIAASSTWIQLKICMLFTGKTELNRLLLVNEPQQEAI